MKLIGYNRAEALLKQTDYRPAELARLLGTTEAYLFQEVWKGNLVATKIGNDVVRFARADVLTWLAGRKQDMGSHRDSENLDMGIGAR